MHIEWSEELALGVPEIDDQHREIFRRFDIMLHACTAGRAQEEIAPLIDFLAEYVAVHFRDEELLQEQSGYPGYAEHRAEHADFAERVAGLRTALATEGPSLILLIRTNKILVDWLINHISNSDRKLAEFLREKRS